VNSSSAVGQAQPVRGAALVGAGRIGKKRERSDDDRSAQSRGTKIMHRCAWIVTHLRASDHRGDREKASAENPSIIGDLAGRSIQSILETSCPPVTPENI